MVIEYLGNEVNIESRLVTKPSKSQGRGLAVESFTIWEMLGQLEYEYI